MNLNKSTVSQNGAKEEKQTSQSKCDQKDFHGHGDKTHSLNEEPRTPVKCEATVGGDVDEQSHSPETTVWIRCDVCDTGIGIPGMPQIIFDMLITFVMQSIICLVFLTTSFLLGWFFIYLTPASLSSENALPTLFKRYMQVSADHARKYGGTGLGLAICKQLVRSSYHKELFLACISLSFTCISDISRLWTLETLLQYTNKCSIHHKYIILCNQFLCSSSRK